MKSKLTSVTVTIGVCLLIFWISHQITTQQLQEVVRHAGVYGPIAFIFLTLITYIFSPISGTPILYAGYYAFGRNAIFYTQAAGLISFALNYWIARLLGRPFIEHFLGHGTRQKLDKFITKYGHVSLYAVRVLLSNFHDYISYAAGLAKMKFSHYMLVSAIALIQETIIWFLLSEKASSPEEFTAWTFMIGVGLSTLFLTGRFFYMHVFSPVPKAEKFREI